MKVFFSFFLVIYIFASNAFLVQKEDTISLKKETLSYTKSSGFLEIKDEKQNVLGKIFYTEYRKKSAEKRPITFCFNGGPGASSVWLHMGAFGPKRFLTKEEGQNSLPPYQWIENQETLLAFSDLVFIDPIGCGLSTCLDEESPNRFYEIEEDVLSIKKAIYTYLQENILWNHPKYLLGESYGTLRAARLAESLHEDGVYLNGIVLISLAIDYQTLLSSPYSHLPEFLTLPTYATTAWKHGLIRQDLSLEEVSNLACDFTYQSYAPFLLSPERFSEKQQKKMAKGLEKFSGIDAKTWIKHRCKMNIDTFVTSLLEKEQKILGFYESSQTANYYPHLSKFHQDPSSIPLEGIFTSGFRDYLQKELGIYPEKLYEILSYDVHYAWDFSSFTKNNSSFIGSLEEALVLSPSTKVFAASGYFDLVTPFAAAEYTLRLMDRDLQKNLSIRNYEGGHMMYLVGASRKKLFKDLEAFYKSSL